MKAINRLIQYFTAVIFIISGAVKLNDPYGTAIKLHEYFEVFSSDFTPLFEYLVPFSLFFSVFLSTFEIVLGIALLIGWRQKLTLKLLAAMVVFFGFLTFYSAYFNKVTDCGCFGDAIKFTPWQSFGKDMLLAVFIFYLIFVKDIGKILSVPARGAIVALSTVACLFMAYYAIEHLPFVDFRPYKVGANIPTDMQPSEPFRYAYTMEKNGKKEVFENYPTDTTYKFVSMDLLNPEAQPKILDYSIWNDDGDFTAYTFDGAKLLVIINRVEESDLHALPQIKALVDEVREEAEPLLLTSSTTEQLDPVRHEYQLDFPFFFGDDTVLKTIIRSNPGIVLMKDGTILGKWHYNDTPEKEDILELINNS
ncbi:BT_3928 family protein [Persicobacter sp. CCB-QB2]|uniref:BT_3928 family protein n=1 Tax=Persicobacter sp. CCB-QB2 TaxID=1561025 RepID=UPI0006A9A4C5|nr:BT_3928 family protein [Persicobacter sp. CCB-QB2]